MTNQKKGLASYDNDQQRKVVGQGKEAMYEKGSTMDRGTSHEFATEDLSEVGEKRPAAVDQQPVGDPENTDPAGQGRVPGSRADEKSSSTRKA